MVLSVASSASVKLPAGAGGLVGFRLAPLLQEGFGGTGTYLALALLIAIALLLATDFVFYAAARSFSESWFLDKTLGLRPVMMPRLVTPGSSAPASD